MTFHEFNHHYKLTRAALTTGESPDVAAAQAQLRVLTAALTGTDLTAAMRLIDGLPALLAAVKAATPSPRSPQMAEALQILSEGKFDEGAREERLAALRDARRRIWALADRAGTDHVAIRGLTRGLETTENYLEDPPWDLAPNNGNA
ncbi:hypothetical protein [Kribbella monticola]|uniref:hypothetical protein n=1 Tax=Kribbella monticola TaxID=2185285 RepID=UPI000DD3E20E|nr:hypothetical protein [Kribbella monticola]